MSTFVRDFLGNFRWGNITNHPFKIMEVRPGDYAHCEVHYREDSLVVYGYRDTTKFEVVLHKDISRSLNTAYSLLRTEEESEAQIAFIQLKDKLPVIVDCVSVLTKDILQEVISTIKENPTWTLAHVSAHFALMECFKHNSVINEINTQCSDTLMTPLHVAVKSGRLNSVQTLLLLEADLNMVDCDGNTAFHYAANTTKEIIQALSVKPPGAVINMFNNDGYTPLYLACVADKPECVKELLRSGADVNVASVDASSCPVEASNKQSAKDVIDTYRAHLYPQDIKFGGTPLHWANSTQVLEAFFDIGCNLDAKNIQGDTALHIMVARNRTPCIITLLSHGANPDLPGADGNTPLHLAVKTGDLTLVHTFIAFGSNINAINFKGETPRHIAATSTEKKGAFKDILFALHAVKATRCSQKTSGCTEGCSLDGTYNGNIPEKNPLDKQVKFYDELIGATAIIAMLAKKERLTEIRSTLKPPLDPGITSSHHDFCRILCLDGGGIRGLITIQVLWELQNVIGEPIMHCFDWISGTSTGGILALALASGKPVQEIRCLYFRLKDRVFVGGRPYDAEPLEKFLQQEMGSTTLMSSISRPKVMVTAVVTNRQPVELHLFRNYNSPHELIKRVSEEEGDNASLGASSESSDELIWKAARASGAAPTYFRASGNFIDGGLMSNNPTLDTLTEIHEYNIALEATGQEHLKEKIGVVVSLGTGKPPVVQVNSIDFFRPDTIWGAAKFAKGASVLAQLLVDQATQADGRVVERAQAWCSMINVPYFRINPPLLQSVALDETDNKVLVKALWEASVYMRNRRDDIEKLATLLKS